MTILQVILGRNAAIYNKAYNKEKEFFQINVAQSAHSDKVEEWSKGIRGFDLISSILRRCK